MGEYFGYFIFIVSGWGGGGGGYLVLVVGVCGDGVVYVGVVCDLVKKICDCGDCVGGI